MTKIDYMSTICALVQPSFCFRPRRSHVYHLQGEKFPSDARRIVVHYLDRRAISFCTILRSRRSITHDGVTTCTLDAVLLALGLKIPRLRLLGFLKRSSQEGVQEEFPGGSLSSYT
jgi:hypothetical protein